MNSLDRSGLTRNASDPSSEKPTIVHIINGLEVGGAECLLRGLVLEQRDHNYRHLIISLGEVGPIGRDLREKGIPVEALGLPSLVQALRNVRPAMKMIRGAAIVQTWLYHANFLGGLISWLFAPVVWSLHTTHLAPRHTKLTTRLIFWVDRWLSMVLPRAIIACSESSYDYHVEKKYNQRRMICIKNGIPTDIFQRSEADREVLRRAWGLDGNVLVAGVVARYDPQKDIGNFIEAAATVLERRPEMRFVMCGERFSDDNADLIGMLERAGVREHFILLGRRSDVPSVLSAFDMFVMSSAYGEALPLALCEAMSCQLPSVVTDVGDCSLVVGDTGAVVPAKSPKELGAAILDLAALDRQALKGLGERARQRIIQSYSFSAMAERYYKLYSEILGGKAI